MQQTLRLELPTREHEDWEYTPLEGLTNSQFVSHAAEIASVQCVALSSVIDAARLVFANRQFSLTLSDSTGGSGFNITIDDACQAPPAAIQPEVFLCLTESLSRNVTHVQAKHNLCLAKPLPLLHITQGLTGDEVNTAYYHHHLELAGGVETAVIEHYTSLSERRHFIGARLMTSVAANAHLCHIKLAFENPFSRHFAHSDIQLGVGATVVNHNFLLSGTVLRHNTSTQLNDESITLRLNSLVMPVKNEICDTRTQLEYNKGCCNSHQLHKTIVSDKGRAVFNGLINAVQHAIKTDGQMINNNLLLGKLAEMGTKLQFEIYADDVKCSHGVMVGRADDEQMFYLRSRGIGQQSAQHVILRMSAAELTEALGDEALER